LDELGFRPAKCVLTLFGWGGNGGRNGMVHIYREDEVDRKNKVGGWFFVFFVLWTIMVIKEASMTFTTQTKEIGYKGRRCFEDFVSLSAQ